jgi:DNA-binding beta-propeller fold protein YncE
MKKYLLFISCLVLMTGGAALKAQTGASGFKIVNRFHIPGNGGWDYLSVDESTGRIFVSHGTEVNVIDGKDGKLLGTIPGTNGVHGIAIAADKNKAFISDGRDSSVTIINLKSLAFIAKVPVTGQNPDAILYDKFSNKVFTFNGRTANATVLDASSDKVVATIGLDGKPEFPVSDGKGRIYVNIEDKSEISVINAVTFKVEQTWSIAPGEEPSGLALDNENHLLFSVCGNKLMVVVDAVLGKVVTTLPIGGRVDGAAFDPVLKLAYSSNGEGTMTVVKEMSPEEFRVIENVTTIPGARTIALNKSTHHLYLPAAELETSAGPGKRPAVKPGTFMVLDIMPVM